MSITEIIERDILPVLHRQEPLWENWYIKECIGTGSFSAVYRTEAKRQSRTDVSALKIQPILPESRFAANAELLQKETERLRAAAEHESAVMYSLRDCRYIVRYEDEDIRPFEAENGLHGYVFLIRMEYLHPLPELIRNGSFVRTESAVRRLAAEIGEGLRAAHAAGIMHRDVKPDNLFVSDDGTCKLGDFNIAKESARTRTYAGTPGFLAPEVLAAKRAAAAGYTAQADIYSFGICLYQMMHDGLFPFEERCSAEEAFQLRMNGEPLPYPKRAANAFGDLILKACAFQPDMRYQTMDDLLHDLAALPPAADDAPVQPAVQNSTATVYAEQGKTEYADHAATVYADSSSPAADPAKTVYADMPAAKPKFPLKKLLIPAACLVLAAGAAGIFALYRNQNTDSAADTGNPVQQTVPEETLPAAEETTAPADLTQTAETQQGTTLTTADETGTAAVSSTSARQNTAVQSGNAAQRENVVQQGNAAQENPVQQGNTAQENPVQQGNTAQDHPVQQNNSPQDHTAQQENPVRQENPVQTDPPAPVVTNPLRYSVNGGTVSVDGFNTPSDDLEIPPQIDGMPVTRISDGAFQGTSIRSVRLPYGLTQIGANAFADCVNLTELSLPDSVTAVGTYAFSGSGVSALRLSSGMTEIGESAFYGCACLPKIIIPDSVSVIGKNAFAECSVLQTVCIPTSVTRIGVNAFAAYPAPAVTVYYAGTMEQADLMQVSDSAFPDAVWEYNRRHFETY